MRESKNMKWTRFISRELNDEEAECYGNMYQFIWDCPIPDEDEEVLLTDGQTIWTEQWIDYGDGQCLENSDPEGLYWMPFSELLKELEKDEINSTLSQ